MNKSLTLGFLFVCFIGPSYGQESTHSLVLEDLCRNQQQTPEETNENGYLIECHFDGADIPSAFERYKQLDIENNANFINKLVRNKNMKVTCSQGGCVEAEYYWPNDKQLDISLLFEGGETTYKYTEEAKGTKLEIRMFPD
ncbi:hypothetical protein U0L13_002245 [Providencia stuartii]|uniref:hypothetical protein n=1 Tax=Providencia stuartii TaxID=588 RepID=UPI001FF663BB|nr:hypothetical protein [Providencia stuartii]ELZ5940029.1 hypothetical protein [Providencia stuartii]MCK1143838.1 hypothetical protein [Providencia stuartii]